MTGWDIAALFAAAWMVLATVLAVLVGRWIAAGNPSDHTPSHPRKRSRSLSDSGQVGNSIHSLGDGA